jgi:hypothetical protein
MTTNPTPTVANLRETRREMAAAEQRHPAGSKAPVKTPAKAPAARAPAKKAPAKTVTPKLRWTLLETSLLLNGVGVADTLTEFHKQRSRTSNLGGSGAVTGYT